MDATNRGAPHMHVTTMIVSPHSPQALQLDASASVDDDDVDINFDFRWYCEDSAGGTCVSRTGETLELSAFMGATVMFLPAGSLPAGELVGTPNREPGAALSPRPRSHLRYFSSSTTCYRSSAANYVDVTRLTTAPHDVAVQFALLCLVEQALSTFSRSPLRRVPLVDQRGHSIGATTPPASS